MRRTNTGKEEGTSPDLGHADSGVHNLVTTGNHRLLDEKKLTIPEAARVMGIGANSLRRIIGQGRLPVLRFMTKTLVLESDVELFLNASRGVVQAAQHSSNRLPALPADVIGSRHLECSKT